MVLFVVMKKIAFFIVGAIFLILGIVVMLRIIRGSTNASESVLKINANPSATVFLNNQHVGKTPLEQTVAPGDYSVKLVPEGTLEQVVSWEGKVPLRSGLLTYVNRELGPTDLNSAGEMLTLEKSVGGNPEVTIVSTPDGATVTIDGVDKGMTPLSLSDISAGEHEVTVSALGSVSRSIRVKVTGGFKLTAVFQLALSENTIISIASPPPSATPSATPKGSNKPTSTPKAATTTLTKPYVEILDTPTGFLRVRESPTTSATESARVKPGETYPFKSAQTGWFEIEYEKAKTGWISSQYAKKVE